MPSLVVLGSNGFLGKALITNDNLSMPVKAVVRNAPADGRIQQENITWFEVDLMDSHSLDDVLSAGDVVVNLAYMADATEIENFCLIENIVESCIRCKVTRLVHCSTAVVIGDTSENLVNESLPCMPATSYEKTKYGVEQRVLNALSRGLDVGILRPTAVVGAGGKNLEKLVKSLLAGNATINYLKVCVLGRMPMHLVPVSNVVAAIFHLIKRPAALEGEIYIVASDDDQDNNYLDIEKMVRNELGVGSYKLPLITLPSFMQVLMFKLLGRSDFNLSRRYDGNKLKMTGFQAKDSVADAIHQFVSSFITDQNKK